MQKSFDFKTLDGHLEIQVSSNEKEYGTERLQYVYIQNGYQSSRGTWSHARQTWQKSPGNPAFNDAVARACGFIQEEG